MNQLTHRQMETEINLKKLVSETKDKTDKMVSPFIIINPSDFERADIRPGIGRWFVNIDGVVVAPECRVKPGEFYITDANDFKYDYSDNEIPEEELTLYFYPISEADKLEHMTRALVRDKNGVIYIALWEKEKNAESGRWVEESALDIGGGIDDLVDFSVIK